jgi:hypothetical protein
MLNCSRIKLERDYSKGPFAHAAVSCANRSVAKAKGHFAATDPVLERFARHVSVEVLVRGFSAQYALSHLETAGAAGPMVARPQPPMPEID